MFDAAAFAAGRDEKGFVMQRWNKLVVSLVVASLGLGGFAADAPATKGKRHSRRHHRHALRHVSARTVVDPPLPGTLPGASQVAPVIKWQLPGYDLLGLIPSPALPSLPVTSGIPALP
jgi:hypothetical protein